MAAPMTGTVEFESWLNDRLDSLEVDRDVYGTYILGVLQEEETDEEKEDALKGILSAFVDEETLDDVCTQIIKRWTKWNCQSAAVKGTDDAEVQAIASMIEKQAQIVVKQKVSVESKRGKEAVLAQYGNVTDEEDEAEEEEEYSGGNKFPGSENSLFKNTNVEEVLKRNQQRRTQAREDAQKKKEMDKMQREKDKLAKQDRKEKEKKRTQKGERKR